MLPMMGNQMMMNNPIMGNQMMMSNPIMGNQMMIYPMMGNQMMNNPMPNSPMINIPMMNDSLNMNKNNYIDYFMSILLDDKNPLFCFNSSSRNNWCCPYILPNEIKEENDIIIHRITQNVYDFLNGVKGSETKIAGEFLYSIGGIARKSLEFSNKIFIKLYQQFLDQESNYTEKNIKNFNIWAKEQLTNEAINDYLKKNFKEVKNYIKEIIKYLNSKNNNTLIYFFKAFLKLYLKCKFCTPFVEVNFELDNDIEYESSIMNDIIFKGEKTKVNFCYLPQLKSNGSIIDGANFYVFTYREEGKESASYKKEPIDY